MRSKKMKSKSQRPSSHQKVKKRFRTTRWNPNQLFKVHVKRGPYWNEANLRVVDITYKGYRKIWDTTIPETELYNVTETNDKEILKQIRYEFQRTLNFGRRDDTNLSFSLKCTSKDFLALRPYLGDRRVRSGRSNFRVPVESLEHCLGPDYFVRFLNARFDYTAISPGTLRISYGPSKAIETFSREGRRLQVQGPKTLVVRYVGETGNYSDFLRRYEEQEEEF